MKPTCKICNIDFENTWGLDCHNKENHSEKEREKNKMTEQISQLSWNVINLMIGMSFPIPLLIIILLTKEILK